MAAQHEINAAYYHGLREMNGIDPSVAEDLGIPMDREGAERQIAAGQEVGRLLSQANALPPTPAADALSTWIAGASRGELRHDIRGEIARQAKAGEIRPEEVDSLMDKYKERKESFKRWPN